ADGRNILKSLDRRRESTTEFSWASSAATSSPITRRIPSATVNCGASKSKCGIIRNTPSWGRSPITPKVSENRQDLQGSSGFCELGKILKNPVSPVYFPGILMCLSRRTLLVTRGLLTCLAFALLSVIASAQDAGAGAKAPTLFLIGDSTVRNGAG